MIQVNVPNFFYFDEISKIRSLGSKNVNFEGFCKNAQKLKVIVDENDINKSCWK